MRAAARALLSRIGAQLDPDLLCRNMSLAERQTVEIAKALDLDARILVLDEPTAALDGADAARLLATIERLRSAGVAIIYVSHRMPEVMALSDRVTVLKDGQLVATQPRSDLDVSSIVRMMVGRDLTAFYPPAAEAGPASARLLEVEGGGNRLLDGISLALREGEIVGVAGLEGSGKTELLRAIYGDLPFEWGECGCGAGRFGSFHPFGTQRRDRSCARGSAWGSFVGAPGCARQFVIGQARAGAAMGGAEAGDFAAPQVDRMLSEAGVRAARYDKPIRLLSGGNQQKVIIARSLASSARRNAVRRADARGRCRGEGRHL